MGATTGLAAIGDYATPATIATRIAVLLGLIPNPDAGSGSGSGAVAGGGFGASNTYLDEMSPAAAAQLRVELAALMTEAGGGDDADVAFGSYVVTAADVTATVATIETGFDDIAIADSAVSIYRANNPVTADADITSGLAGEILVADGAATYVLTAGDVINWFVTKPAA